MKKLVVLAMAALPMFAMAQEKEKTNATPPAKPEIQRPNSANGPESIFIELIITQTSVGNKIKADFGRELMSSLNDKELVQTLSDLRNADYATMPDAMNALAMQGFKFVTNYSVKDKDNKEEVHMVFEKRLMRKPNAGSGKPEGKPEGRPDAKPVTQPESKPAAKPSEKGGKK
jgi:hypothetical protein